jgi:hypothetical protein
MSLWAHSDEGFAIKFMIKLELLFADDPVPDTPVLPDIHIETPTLTNGLEIGDSCIKI